MCVIATAAYSEVPGYHGLRCTRRREVDEVRITRNDLRHERVVRLTYSVGDARGSEEIGETMDGAVTAEQWVRLLNDVAAALGEMVAAEDPAEEPVSCQALQCLRHGRDVSVYDPDRHHLHYTYGARCVRRRQACASCLLGNREAGAACPRRYDERKDRCAPRILIVDDDWNAAGSVQTLMNNTALWHQRVESWREAVRTLAFALLFDQPDTVDAAEEVADSLFSGFRDDGHNLPDAVFFAARPFWDLCATTTISLAQDFCGPGALANLEPDLVVERMLELQADLNHRARLKRYKYSNPLAVTITQEEAGMARTRLLEHINRLLRGQARDRGEEEPPDSRSEVCA
jgi:hypothetical protein